jgi:hypothetical protein
MPGVEFVDIGQASTWMRTIKSAEEHKLIREGARICNVGGRAVMSAVKAGVPEHEIAIASTNAMIREIGQNFPFVELMDTWTWFQSGINTDGAHNPVTNRKVKAGDILSLNCFPMIVGYYTALERTLFGEYASDAHLDYWKKNCEVMRVGCDLIKPGKKCSEISCIPLSADGHRTWSADGILRPFQHQSGRPLSVDGLTSRKSRLWKIDALRVQFAARLIRNQADACRKAFCAYLKLFAKAGEGQAGLILVPGCWNHRWEVGIVAVNRFGNPLFRSDTISNGQRCHILSIGGLILTDRILRVTAQRGKVYNLHIKLDLRGIGELFDRLKPLTYGRVYHCLDGRLERNLTEGRGGGRRLDVSDVGF